MNGQIPYSIHTDVKFKPLESCEECSQDSSGK